MKTNKALKRLAKIEALMSDVTERYSASAPHIRELLQSAKAAVTRAKEAVSLRTSSGTAKNPAVEHSAPPSKATPEPSEPKWKLSAAGRKAIVAATKKRWAAFHAAKQAEKPEPAVPKKAKPKKTAAKKTAVKTTVKKATKVAVQKAAPKKLAPVKTAKAPVKKTARKSAPMTAQPKAAAESASTPEVLV
jgi:adenylate kinase